MSERGGGPLVQIALWRLRELLREPEAVFWVFAFPVLLALALGVAFQNRAPQALTIVVQQGSGAEEVAAALGGQPELRTVTLDSTEARARLRTGRAALLVIPGSPVTFAYDTTREESHLARLLANDALQRAGGRRNVREVRDVAVTEPGSRYIDFLIPGLLGLNIMGTGLWGIGFGIVKTRQQKLLKRMLAAPMRKGHYLLGQIAARLVFLVAEVGIVLAFGVLAFGVPVRGAFPVLAGVVTVGAATFAGLGILVASRARTIEGVSGLMNLVMVPMWILSGVFFSWAHFPEAMHPLIRALPLTALNDGLRAVLLDGTGLIGVTGELGIMAIWGLVSFGVALKIFRWM